MDFYDSSGIILYMDGLIKRYITWEEVHRYCNELIDDIIRQKWKFNYIIAIGKGGLVPATIIGNQLKLDVVNMGLRSYTDEHLQENFHLYQMPINHLNDENYMNILVVDDINDSGSTFQYVSKYLSWRSGPCSESPPYVHYWSLFRRYNSSFGEQRQNRKDYLPDEIELYSQGEDIHDNSWLVMPWENKKYVR